MPKFAVNICGGNDLVFGFKSLMLAIRNLRCSFYIKSRLSNQGYDCSKSKRNNLKQPIILLSDIAVDRITLMIGLLNESDWKIQKREPYQKYKDYEYVINQALESVQTIGERLNDKELLKDKPKGAIYLSSNHFFEASLELIVFSYSAGVSAKVLSEYFPNVLYALKQTESCHLDFHQSSECDGHLVPHLELVTGDYWEALQLVCFSILFAQPEHLPTIVDILAYENDE